METRRVMRIIFSRFALLSLGCIGALALVMSFVLSSLLTQAASEWEWENTAALVRREVRMAGLEGVFAAPGSPEDRERWGRTFSSLLTSLPEVVRAKVWDNQATILWSDESHLIGRRFLDNDELRDALKGKLEVEIKSLTKAEHGYERPAFTTLAEIYVPIFSGDGRVLGVVEVYKTPERLLATIRRGRIAVWSISFAGALLLYLVMHPLLTQVYRKEVQEDTLRAETGRLETEVAERTTQLFQAQKMEAVGLLAGGIAHDFNNLLTVIMGRAQLLLRGRPADDPLAQGLALIDMTAQRAAALTRQLLAFSRKQVLQRRVLNLNSVVVEMEKMLRPLIGEDIVLLTVFEPALGPVNADPGQLEQVILNLTVNARDAMPQGGQIVLKTENVQLDAATAARQPGLQAGGYAVLAVSDTGVGMDPTTQARIFEPFFTTKEPGKGTGLGLSTVYGIVQQHSGFVSVESASGQGTTFKIHLPHVEAVVEAPVAGPTRVASGGGSETVLVVEDEDEVRALAIEILRGEGYATLAAADGTKALRVAARHPGPLHLLLTDVVMPHVNGWELARRLSAVRPETKVLYMTGYSEIAVAHEGVSDGIVLQKPFTPDGLASKVRETIQAVKIAG
ncbi:MAG: ATP-binding protein [Candidatus Rokubacteria bacterium]|nr:ATP-binding protein [Candidatus Rokubacteria bacterium]